MNGVPPDLPVADLIGRDLTYIGLALHQIQFHFDGGAHMHVGGGWSLKDSTGHLLDEHVDPPADRMSYKIHRLLMQPVTRASVDPPHSFSITFENGDVLTILDNSPYYESFSLRVNGREFYV
jgi:hypothetical protein